MNTPAIIPAHTVQGRSSFEMAALERGHNWTCRTCGTIHHASELIWEDPIVPSCPSCFTMDDMEEN